MNMPADTAPEQPADGARGDADTTPAPPGPPLPPLALPVQSREDTDAGWGEYAEPDDNERFARDRPPHWDDS